MADKKESIKEAMDKLERTVSWFETQNEVNVEEGLKKAKEGAALIKKLKDKIKMVENEFNEIKEELDND